jgi:hypothetical protein
MDIPKKLHDGIGALRGQYGGSNLLSSANHVTDAAKRCQLVSVGKPGELNFRPGLLEEIISFGVGTDMASDGSFAAAQLIGKLEEHVIREVSNALQACGCKKKPTT